MKNPHDQIEMRFSILFIGLIILFDGNGLWVSLTGGVFVAFAILRLIWRDIYKAMIQ